MATGQSLLDAMELLNQELQVQSGEPNVTRALTALNISQDYLETLMAARGKGCKSGVGTVVTAANTEATAFPTGLLRVDRLHRLDSNGKVVAELHPLRRTGGHAVSHPWVWTVTLPSGSGAPAQYWTNSSNIYWSPLPDAVYTVRWYGLQRASDITASGTFAYDDGLILPVASFATRLMKSGVDDQVEELTSLAAATFKAALDQLDMTNRDGAVGLEYTEVHTE